MKYNAIRIEGSILSYDILDLLSEGDEQVSHQTSESFGFEKKVKLKEIIIDLWTEAQAHWTIFKRHRERIIEKGKSSISYETGKTETGVSETRVYFIEPLLRLLGYELEKTEPAIIINNNYYPINYRGKANLPVYIIGFNEDMEKAERRKLSPHSCIQEYLNLTEEHLYGILTDGLRLRILRDCSRLIRLSYLEFDLEKILEEKLFSEFAIMFRLIHSSRMPQSIETASECILERYHQDALDHGARIRDKLSEAVKISIERLANGFIKKCDNQERLSDFLKDEGADLKLNRLLLRLVYKILFLIVIEERNLVFENRTDSSIRDIYYNYYSVTRLRKLSEKKHVYENNYSDLWNALLLTFKIFENGRFGEALEIKPLNGDLFKEQAISILNECCIENRDLLSAICSINTFIDAKTGSTRRINYASLNVEEFGSVYESLLDFKPFINTEAREFALIKGNERSTTGSHYTPDELVQPLIRHSLDYIIEEKRKEADVEKALLSIKVCDIASGSGHMLLNAARRIGLELARVRSRSDQPPPPDLRKAVRDVIRHCIYGVDKNELAVELCRVSLWLEAHCPGEPLSFLDHHIKCGDAIVGLAYESELEKGIPDEAFKKIYGDDADVSRRLLRTNKDERKNAAQQGLDFSDIKSGTDEYIREYLYLDMLPEDTADRIDEKKKRFDEIKNNSGYWRTKQLADIVTAQFFMPKTSDNEQDFVTDGEFRKFLENPGTINQKKAGKASEIAQKKQFFHYFLEFPEIMEQGGFDCILGNPPYLGTQSISGTHGDDYLNWLQTEYYPSGGCDIVTYFLRRDYEIMKENGFCALIATNTISQGRTRESGLFYIVNKQGEIVFAKRSVRWPGIAKVFVSLLSLRKKVDVKTGYFYQPDVNLETEDIRSMKSGKILDNIVVPYISAMLTYYPEDDLLTPYSLDNNKNKMFQGSIFLGEGFLLDENKRNELIEANPKNAEVIFPLLNGKDLNDRYDQSPSRYIINFFDWPEEKAMQYEEPYRIVKDSNENKNHIRENWWLFHRSRPALYNALSKLDGCFVVARARTKYLNFSKTQPIFIFSDGLFVFTSNSFIDYCIVQNSFYDIWVRKYSSTYGIVLRYSPTDCFENFPFPVLTPDMERTLEEIGKTYHEHRRQMMLKMKLGLTKTYNLFHDKDLTVEKVRQESKLEDEDISGSAYQDILKLRELHKNMDDKVLEAYGWTNVNLEHSFHEVDYLPEEDRIRYTISETARREILKRLLELNHKYHEEELKSLPAKISRKKKIVEEDEEELLGE
ncbi:MAG: restriction endonuclease [Candidatus Coatesbacteria bacterium]|nr:restriction endonuclease [Candidatus Coatesbacteria bacterium]